MASYSHTDHEKQVEELREEMEALFDELSEKLDEYGKLAEQWAKLTKDDGPKKACAETGLLYAMKP